MADFLLAYPLTRELLDQVQNLDCGSEAYQEELAAWFREEAPKILGQPEGQGTRIWLFCNQAGEQVGYGSLGATNWRYPTAQDPRRTVHIIPAVAVQRPFWGLPKGEGEKAYSCQILDFLMEQAVQSSGAESLLGLYVHPENERALRFYERNDFVRLKHQTYLDPQTNVRYVGLVRKIAGEE